MAHALLNGQLQAMIDGVPRVLPNPKKSLIGVEPPSGIDYKSVRILAGIDLAAQLAAERICDAGSFRQPRTRNAIPRFCSKQFVAGRTHIVELNHDSRINLMLHPQKPVLDVRVSNPFWKHDGSVGRDMWIR